MNTKDILITLSIFALLFSVTSKTEAAGADFVMTSSTPVQETVVWPQIHASSAIVYDPISAKVIYQKDADTVRPIASIAKLMTASVADTILSWSTQIAQKPLKISKVKDSDAADKILKNGTLWNPADLIKYMLIGSSNKASEVIASSLVQRSVFLSLMNHSAKEWGLSHTTFNNPSGLTVIGKNKIETPGALSTAREVAFMMWHIVENHQNLLDPTREQLASFSAGNKNVITIKNTNTLLSELPIIFGKTGFTEQSGGNLAVVIQKNETSHPYIIVVLGSTLNDRFSDVQALASTTQKVLTFQK